MHFHLIYVLRHCEFPIFHRNEAIFSCLIDCVTHPLLPLLQFAMTNYLLINTSSITFFFAQVSDAFSFNLCSTSLRVSDFSSERSNLSCSIDCFTRPLLALLQFAMTNYLLINTYSITFFFAQVSDAFSFKFMFHVIASFRFSSEQSNLFLLNRLLHASAPSLTSVRNDELFINQ
jgi:hypothetical protein